VNIEYIGMPSDLSDKYQNFTEAEMQKWVSAGLDLPSTTLENGIKNYVQEYLMTGKNA
jgi:ADP-L-glycero-D-manno-heptose 6-epimerase